MLTKGPTNWYSNQNWRRVDMEWAVERLVRWSMGNDSSLYRSIWEHMEYSQIPGDIFFSTFKFFIDFIDVYNIFRYNQENFLICWVQAMNEITEKNNFNFLDLNNRRALLLSKTAKTLVLFLFGGMGSGVWIYKC